MNYLTPNHRLALLMHDGTDNSGGKTGLALLRYSPLPIVAVIDRRRAGGNLAQITGIPREVPIVASLQSALAYDPTVLAIGIAPSGGALPDPWYQEVKAAVAAGLSVVNGLHRPLGQDPALPLTQPDQWIWDVRQEPPGLSVGMARARTLACRRVLAVGTDMAVGKMSANLELHRAARARGLRSKVIATGQTNLMLGDDGVALDAVRVDFAAGAVEQVVMRYGPDHDILFIEGQGSLFNPASTATLPLMRGSQPTHLILAHRAGQTHIKNCPEIPIPPLPEAIRVCETLVTAGGAFLAAQVVGVALNTHHLGEQDAIAAIQSTQTQTGLPCTDVLRFGPDPLLAALLATPMPKG
ncbi:DUF1611 domain-containing protein [Leptolyngbya sp. PCC 6406]|uniref:DUF1611 domain-containing protein n=1 Tax=Leptolyngbya sp. PCC 6406 TaxID=1173264 RepID=UPI0002AC7E7A|nr:DUF1611 domain-containing protein [Leptolyngbya sp. PCC 6406]